MGSNTQQPATDSQQTRAYAGYYGLWTGACWIFSFSLSMASLHEPWLGNFAMLAGLCSIPLVAWLMRGFRQNVAPLPLRRAWHMAWLTFLAAALLTTAAQYIYFAYIDDGMLARTYSSLLTQPEYRQLLEQFMPGQDADTMVDEVVTMFNETSASALAMQFLLWNSLIATVFAIPTMLWSRTGK